MSEPPEQRAASSWRSGDTQDMHTNKEMASRQLDALQESLMHTEWEVRRLVEELGRGHRRLDPEHLCAIMVQLRSYQVRVYDMARLLEQCPESTVVKTIRRRKRHKRSYKK